MGQYTQGIITILSLTLFIQIVAYAPAAALSAEQGVEQATQDAIEQAATQAAEDIVGNFSDPEYEVIYVEIYDC